MKTELYKKRNEAVKIITELNDSAFEKLTIFIAGMEAEKGIEQADAQDKSA